VSRDVEVQDPVAGVLDHKKQYHTRNVAVGTVNRSKAMMASRWLRTIASHSFGIAPALNAPQIACHGPFGYDEAELLKLAVDPRSAPVGAAAQEDAGGGKECEYE
jgi:hypothetical protein